MAIKLDESTHTYTRDDGAIIPGVTSSLKILGLYEGVDEETLNYKAAIGRAAHKCVELIYKRRLDWDSVHEAVMPYAIQAGKFMDEAKNLYASMVFENIVYHSKYIYAGTYDIKATTFTGEHHLIEIKCTASFERESYMQVGAYANAHNYGANTKDKVTDQYILHLGTDKYKVQDVKEKYFDFPIFLAALNINNWRLKNGRK